MSAALRDQAIIAGIGETEYSKASGRTELALACEAIAAAADDAGIEVSEIDGLVRFDMDSVDEVALTSHAGLRNLRWMSHTGYGGTGGNAVIVHAAAAIAAGLANTVVCYRALNERSGARYGQASTWMAPEVGGFEAFQMPWGMLTPAHAFGQFARRHMIEYGTTSEQFGHVAVTLRSHAARNPRAMMRKPITLADHQASRMIADPLRLFDCCIESDGACAVIVTRADRAPGLRHPPAWIMGAAQGSGTRAVGIVFRDDLATPESVHTAADVYRSAGIGPDEVDAVMIYDHFTPFVIMSLEAYGFCRPGRGRRVRRRRPHRLRRCAARQHPRRQPLRGLHPRIAPCHRGGAPAPWHLDLAGRRMRGGVVVQLGRPTVGRRDPEEGLTMLSDLPRPRPDLDTAPFWDGCRDGRFLLPVCASCGQARWPPGPMCPSCQSMQTRWEPAPDRGRLYSWVTVTHPVDEALAEQVPYVVALVELTEGVRVVANIVGCSPDTLSAGETVEMFFEERADGLRLPNFRREHTTTEEDR